MSRIGLFNAQGRSRVVICFFALSLASMFVAGLSPTAFGQGAAPSLKKLQPDTITVDSPTFTLRISGVRFRQGARALFDGKVLESSRLVEGNELILAEIDSSLIAGAATHTVQVLNPDGLATERRSLSVVEPDPERRIRLEGNAVEEGQGTDQTLELTGEDLRKASKVYVAGIRSPKTLLSDRKLTFTIPASLTTAAAYLPVTVIDKDDGGMSNTEIFYVVPRPASLESVDPEIVEVGSNAFKVQVRGNDFKAGARILVNGNPLITTNPETGLLEAVVPGMLRSSAGQLFVRVEQEGIQSADLNIVVSPSDAPFLLAASPTKIRQLEPTPLIWIVGSDFTHNLDLLIDGQIVEDSQVNRKRRTLVKVRLSDELISRLGPHTLQLIDRNGISSNITSFEVVSDVAVTTLAGGKEGSNPTCVSMDAALFRRPSRLTMGADGLIYVVDYQNHMIRSLDPVSSQVCTVAGAGIWGYSDSGDSPDFEPVFSYPLGILAQSDGTILVSDGGNDVIRRIRRGSGGAIKVETYAGANRTILSEDKRSRLHSTREGLRGFRAGEAATAAFRKPDDMVLAADGSIYVSDASNHSIRRIRQTGDQIIVETIAGNGAPGYADGDAANARFNVPTGLALSPDGQTLFVADTNNHRIRRINLSTLRVETLAGNGEEGNEDGPPFIANFRQPTGLAILPDGTIYVSEVGAGRIRQVDSSGNVSVVAGGFFNSASKNRDGSGVEARFSSPRGITLDVLRRVLYVADLENSSIRKIELPQ
jgi:sugar lactone lactonase YvrE